MSCRQRLLGRELRQVCWRRVWDEHAFEAELGAEFDRETVGDEGDTPGFLRVAKIAGTTGAAQFLRFWRSSMSCSCRTKKKKTGSCVFAGHGQIKCANVMRKHTRGPEKGDIAETRPFQGRETSSHIRRHQKNRHSNHHRNHRLRPSRVGPCVRHGRSDRLLPQTLSGRKGVSNLKPRTCAPALLATE